MDAGGGAHMEAAPCGRAAAGRLMLQVERVTGGEAPACFSTSQRGGLFFGAFSWKKKTKLGSCKTVCSKSHLAHPFRAPQLVILEHGVKALLQGINDSSLTKTSS